MPCRGYRGYISSRMIECSVPQSVQQLVIREYCRKNRLEFLLSATEYQGGYTMLNSLMNDKAIEGVVLYSIFQLPEGAQRRLELYIMAIEHGKNLHFAAENIAIGFADASQEIEDTLDMAGRLEDIFMLRRIMNDKGS